ncbi:TPA: hypothetical protein QCX63_002102 [Bacillus pacificus]|uniref:hypothetical protein n=1 Tax=Bacillus pacificus TaxID=2026187 RepID=UPI002E1EC4ED|nr:hypothetical protein [Bacillus pacificus]HDR7485979.1 hypothetical protein [Bacillus pacificus]
MIDTLKKLLLPSLFAGTLLLTACGNEEQNAKKKADKEFEEYLKQAEERMENMSPEEKKALDEKATETANRLLNGQELSEFLDIFYKQPNQSEYYEQNVHKQMYALTGYVMDKTASTVYISANPTDKKWNQLEQQERAFVLVAKMSDKKALDSVKIGDKKKIIGDIESRGANMPDKNTYANFKMYGAFFAPEKDK